MPTTEENKATAELEAKAIAKKEAEALDIRREAIRLGLTPQQEKFLKYVKEVKAKGYVEVPVIGFTTITTTKGNNTKGNNKGNNAFIVNPVDSNGNLYNLVTLVVNTDDADCNVLLPTIAKIVEQNIFPTIDLNIGFQVKIFNSGAESIILQSAFEDGIGAQREIELGTKASAILSPVATNNWSIQLTK
jgi:hypothetical protein